VAAQVGTYRRVGEGLTGRVAGVVAEAPGPGRIFLHSRWMAHVEKRVNLWSQVPLLWSNLWDQKNVELSSENPLRPSRPRA